MFPFKLYKSTKSLAFFPEAIPRAIIQPVEVQHIISKQSSDFFSWLFFQSF